jgi:hypothetical protein
MIIDFWPRGTTNKFFIHKLYNQMDEKFILRLSGKFKVLMHAVQEIQSRQAV